MTSQAADNRKQLSKILLFVGAVPSACLGGALTLSGLCLGSWWIVALIQGRSAAELPDPIYFVLTFLMLPAGITPLVLLLLSLSGKRIVAIVGAAGNILFGLLGIVFLCTLDATFRYYAGIPLGILSAALLVAGLLSLLGQWLRR
jgi:hypothetical protein